MWAQNRDVRYAHLTIFENFGRKFYPRNKEMKIICRYFYFCVNFFYQRTTLRNITRIQLFRVKFLFVRDQQWRHIPKCTSLCFLPNENNGERCEFYSELVHLTIFNSLGRNSIQETKSPAKLSKRNEAPG